MVKHLVKHGVDINKITSFEKIPLLMILNNKRTNIAICMSII